MFVCGWEHRVTGLAHRGRSRRRRRDDDGYDNGDSDDDADEADDGGHIGGVVP